MAGRRGLGEPGELSRLGWVCTDIHSWSWTAAQNTREGGPKTLIHYYFVHASPRPTCVSQFLARHACA